MSCSQALSCTGGPLKACHQSLPYANAVREGESGGFQENIGRNDQYGLLGVKQVMSDDRGSMGHND